MDNPMELIKSLLMERAATAGQNSKGFSDMLRERRQFVQGNENAVGDSVQNSIQNGSNGVPINPVEANQDFLNYHTDNANKTAQLTQEAGQFGDQELSSLQALASILSAAAGQDVQRGQLTLEQKKQALAEQEQNRKNFESGYDPTASTTGNKNGVQALTEVIRQGGADLLADAPDDKTKQQMARDIIAAGGVDKYRGTAKPSTLKRQMLESVDSLLGADTKPITGLFQIEGMIPGTKAQTTVSTFNQLKGLLSLDNVKFLKGQGQVSDAERKLLADASSKLNRNLSDTEFRKILTDLKKGLGGKVEEKGKTKVGNYVIEEIK